MPGRALQAYHAILEAVSTGPKSKTELKRVCQLDVCHEAPVLDRWLRELRGSGLIECRGKLWYLARDKQLCPECRGRGLQTVDRTA